MMCIFHVLPHIHRYILYCAVYGGTYAVAERLNRAVHTYLAGIKVYGHSLTIIMCCILLIQKTCKVQNGRKEQNCFVWSKLIVMDNSYS